MAPSVGASLEELRKRPDKCRLAPENADHEIEIRQVFEASDFPAEIFPPEAAAREQAMRDELQKAAKR